jgi:hypothetical protein
VADRTEYYRGYDIGLYYIGRPNVRAMIFEKNRLPPIPAGALEKTVEAALREAQRLIDGHLAARSSN